MSTKIKILSVVSLVLWVGFGLLFFCSLFFPWKGIGYVFGFLFLFGFWLWFWGTLYLSSPSNLPHDDCPICYDVLPSHRNKFHANGHVVTSGHVIMRKQ